MIQSITRKNTIYYQLALGLLMASLLGVTFYFLKMGLLDGSKSKNLHRVNFILETIEKNRPLSEVRSLVVNENNKFALSRLDSFEKNLREINQIISDSDFSQVYEEHQQIKSNIASLVSFTKTDKVIEIFNTKLNRFYEFASDNKWRTLSRSSKRILTLTRGHINKTRLSSFIDRVNKEVSLMEKVTKDSVLSSSEKSEIQARINQFKVETKMLKKYNLNKNDFLGMIKAYDQTVKAWIAKITPEILEQRLKLEHVGRYFLLSLTGLFLLAFSLFTGGFLFNKKRQKTTKKEFESFIQEYISENIIKGQSLGQESFSEEFIEYSKDTQEYIDKRMSFGLVFQKTIPFATVLFDHNLKCEWANDRFISDWNLGTESLSWDYLADFTNLSEVDPVIEAVRNNVGGIYQIKLNLNNSNSIPYEMYVSPVELKGEMKVMVFFYSLETLQETIDDQAISIINPVSRALKLMEQNSLNADELNKLEDEFKLAKISSLFSSFVSFQIENESQKNRLFDEIELLNFKLNEYSDALFQINDDSVSSFESLKNIKEGLKTFKENVIELIHKYNGLAFDSKKKNELLFSTVKTFKEQLVRYSDLKDKSNLSLETLNKLLKIKGQMKASRIFLDEEKARLSHALSSFVHMKSKIENQDLKNKFNNSYVKLNNEYETFKEGYSQLEKQMINFEVLMSKNEMLIQSFYSNLNDSHLIHIENKLDEAQDSLESNRENLDIEKIEENIVSALKDMYKASKKSEETFHHCDQKMSKLEPYKGFLSESRY